MSTLRQLFDGFYVRTESRVNALKDYQDDRRCAKAMGRDPRVTEQYACVIRPYWKQFRVICPPRFWFDLYANPHKPFSPKYIPNDLWFRRIVPHYSDTILAKAWQDKCIYNLLFADIRQPVTVVKNIADVYYDDGLGLLTERQTLDRCRSAGRVIIKASVGSGGGQNIGFFDMADLTDQAIRDILGSFRRDFIVQEKMAQHPDMARLNPSSLNTLKILTFLHGDQVHVLSAALRVGGVGSELDNLATGGVLCTVRAGGRVDPLAMRRGHGRWEYLDQPIPGVDLAAVTVPSFDRALDIVRAHAARMAHFKLIGWDIAIAPDGEPVLIEFNALPGMLQYTDGPIFGDLTDQVLEEVFGRR